MGDEAVVVVVVVVVGGGTVVVVVVVGGGTVPPLEPYGADLVPSAAIIDPGASIGTIRWPGGTSAKLGGSKFKGV